jgi:hypothetical protein
LKQATSPYAAASLFVIAIATAMVPLQEQTAGGSGAMAIGFPGWPIDYDGHPLQELPLTPRELAFVQEFPGRIGRFWDGRREIIIRWVDAPTRRLHAAVDCFRASGYSVVALAARRDGNGAPMGCFRASRGDESIQVCELIRDQQGQSWPDVSAWYWHVLLGTTRSPWWSIVVAEQG